MVGFHRVVRILQLDMKSPWDELVKDPWVDRCPVGGDLDRRGPIRECPAEERACRRQVASVGQPDVDDLAVLIDRPVQVRPAAGDLHVGLVDEPPVTRNMATRPGGLDELRGEPVGPTGRR